MCSWFGGLIMSERGPRGTKTGTAKILLGSNGVPLEGFRDHLKLLGQIFVLGTNVGIELF